MLVSLMCMGCHMTFPCVLSGHKAITFAVLMWYKGDSIWHPLVSSQDTNYLDYVALVAVFCVLFIRPSGCIDPAMGSDLL